jgi:hypothetical protein
MKEMDAKSETQTAHIAHIYAEQAAPLFANKLQVTLRHKCEMKFMKEKKGRY